VRTGLSKLAIYIWSTWPFRQRIFEHDIGLAEWARMHNYVALPSPRPCSRRVSFGYTSAKRLKGALQGEQFLRKPLHLGAESGILLPPLSAPSTPTLDRGIIPLPAPPRRRQVRAQCGVWRPIGTAGPTPSDAKLAHRHTACPALDGGLGQKPRRLAGVAAPRFRPNSPGNPFLVHQFANTWAAPSSGFLSLRIC
jgi:hypothetical protein